MEKLQKYLIGVDLANDKYTYCIFKNGDIIQIIFNQLIRNEKYFNEEVENLTKYFDDVILIEKQKINHAK